MTFRPHPNPEGLLVSHGGWDDGNGGIDSLNSNIIYNGVAHI